jgi:SAM-dependent methyltransferase
MRAVFAHEVDRFGQSFPRGREYRKYWEVCMAVRALDRLGALRGDAEVLGVGAGNEPTIFWLTNFVRRVFATDLYLTQGSWKESANESMLFDAGRHWPGPWHGRRLVVQHMNALDLQYEDKCFDGVFTSSSIEHFGSIAEVRAAATEMHRVLKPGGILSLSTEFRIEGPAPGLKGILMFDTEQICEEIVGDLGWDVVRPFDDSVSSATLASEQLYSQATKDLSSHVKKHKGIKFQNLVWSHYPHLVLREKRLLWTSVHIVLQRHA